MSMRSWDRGIGAAFVLLGAALLAAGWQLPPGLAGVPGPGFFPILIGLGLMILGATLAVAAHPAGASYWKAGLRDAALGQVFAIVGLLVLYVALWDVVPFIVRTPLLLAGIYRVVGEPWLRSILVSIVATTVLVGAFQTLLRVRL